ncbi:MAG: transcriptional regulator, TetR family, partial [Solirubrobacterales bacterium]|nr:transcriptional regulator, TetR family [Solirubrobacterales bacterium]
MNTPGDQTPAKKRTYRLGARADTVRLTRERILDAVADALSTRWYDELTFAELARAAGVSGPTLTNHFGDKDGLIAAYALERMSEEISEVRYSVKAGDTRGVIRVLLDDYERTGDMIIRMLALEHRFPALTDVLAEGRAKHRDWVAHVFDPYLPSRGRRRENAVTRLVVCTDVYAWQLLRRDMGQSRTATRNHLLATVEAVVASS